MADDAIIFTDKAGRTVTRAELDSPESVLGWKGVDEDVPAEAVKLHSEGRTHAEGGDINKAIENFEAAAELAPNWPHPVYDCAVAHLMMDLYGESLDLFEKVECMEPEGFVGTKAAVWSLQREKNGELPRGVFKAYMQVGWVQDLKARADGLVQMVQNVPKFAPAWRDLGMLIANPEQAMQAVQNGVAANPDPDTLGTLLVKMSLIFHGRGDEEAALELSGNLALQPTSTCATRCSALHALRHMTKSKSGDETAR